jgi:hypothetical protein
MRRSDKSRPWHLYVEQHGSERGVVPEADYELEQLVVGRAVLVLEGEAEQFIQRALG